MWKCWNFKIGCIHTHIFIKLRLELSGEVFLFRYFLSFVFHEYIYLIFLSKWICFSFLVYCEVWVIYMPFYFLIFLLCLRLVYITEFFSVMMALLYFSQCTIGCFYTFISKWLAARQFGQFAQVFMKYVIQKTGSHCRSPNPCFQEIEPKRVLLKSFLEATMVKPTRLH